MLSRLVIAFLPKSKHILISWLQSPSAVTLEPKVAECSSSLKLEYTYKAQKNLFPVAEDCCIDS